MNLLEALPRFSISVIGLCSLLIPSATEGQHTTEYSESVQITVANVVAPVQVRFMSLGPGGCAVEAYTSGLGPPQRLGVLAPPGTWTGWETIFEHSASLTITIHNDVKCDTGVRSQVRYFPGEDGPRFSLSGEWETEAESSPGSDFGLPSGTCATRNVYRFPSVGTSGSLEEVTECSGEGFRVRMVLPYDLAGVAASGSDVVFRRLSGLRTMRFVVTRGDGTTEAGSEQIGVAACTFAGTFSSGRPDRISGRLTCRDASGGETLFRR